MPLGRSPGGAAAATLIVVSGGRGVALFGPDVAAAVVQLCMVDKK